MLWPVLLLPLFGAIISKFKPHRSSNKSFFFILSSLSLVSFLTSVLAYNEFVSHQYNKITLSSFTWLKAGSLRIPFELGYNQLDGIFIMGITGVSSILHLFNSWTNRSKEVPTRFLAIYNLLVFNLILATLSKSMPAAFIAWQSAVVFSSLLVLDIFHNKKNFHLNPNFIQSVMTNFKPLSFLSSISVELDNKLIDGVAETTMTIINIFSGVISFSMQGSTQRHASLIILGLMIFSALTFTI